MSADAIAVSAGRLQLRSERLVQGMAQHLQMHCHRISLQTQHNVLDACIAVPVLPAMRCRNVKNIWTDSG